MQLEKLSLKELRVLQAKVSKAIFNFEKKRKAEALSELKALARSKGFSLEEILEEINGKKAKAPISAKYADPSDPDHRWSGRGRRPKWIVEALRGGASLEDFAL